MRVTQFVLGLAGFLALAHFASAGPAPAPVPETGSTLGLLAVGFIAVAGLRRKLGK